jgi:hypothetical protein
LLALEPSEQRGKEHLCRKHGSESTLMRPREFSDTTGAPLMESGWDLPAPSVRG